VTFLGAPLPLLGGAFAALGAALTALYVLKLRRRRVEVPFAELWRRVLSDVESSALWRRLRRWLSLLVQLALLALVLLSIADPHLAGSRRGRTVAIVVDTSASMQARGASGVTRLDEAKERARAIVRGLGGEDTAVVIDLGARPAPRTGVTADERTLLRAIDALHADDAPADLDGALRLATAALRGGANPTLVLIGDGAWDTTALDRAELAGADLRYQPVGEEAENFAITAFSVRRYRANQTAYEVLVEVQRFGGQGKRACTLELAQDGEVVNVEHLTLAAGERVERLYPNLAGAGTRLEASLRAEGGGALDALAVDDHAFALLPARGKTRVLLVTPGNLFLEGALLLDENLDVQKIAPASWAPAEAAKFDAVVLDGFVPPAPPATHALYLDPHGPASPFAIRGELAAPIVTETAQAHPLMRWVTLADLNISRASRFRLDPGDVAIASSLREPIVVARERDGHKLVAIGFDPKKSDLPMRVAFPVLVVNALDWFAGADTGVMTSYSLDHPWRLGAPGGASEITVQDPDGHASRLPVHDGRATWVGTRVGYYQLSAALPFAEGGGVPRGAAAGATRLIAANLVSPSESRLTPRRELTLHGQPVRAPEPGRAGVRRALWPYLVLLTLLLSLGEWWTYNRRVTV
jgi:hypothetical protein